MPSLSTARRVANAKTNNAKTIGQIYKENSDWLMEATWDNDMQSKICYIYDYFHDDFFIDKFGNERTLKSGMTYDNTNKTRIDAKFIVKSYQSMDKDQVDYYLQFKPLQSFEFSQGDELYYFETDYRMRYSSQFPIGMYVDLPDDKGIYHKWLICRGERANQFPKFLILPCDYELMWIEQNGNERIKRRMWSVLRQQSSYTIGTYTDRYFTRVDNQNKLWLPLNSITEKIWYTDEETKNMRLVVSVLTEHPIVWTVTKVENISPIGIQKLTLYQNIWNDKTDYVNLETGEMYANYFESKIEPVNSDDISVLPLSSITAKISASTSFIKVGGSYKSLIANFYNDSNDDITEEYFNASFAWTCNIDTENTSEDWTDKVTWKNGSANNQMKVKFPSDKNQLRKVLIIKCVITKDTEVIEAEPLRLELIE